MFATDISRLMLLACDGIVWSTGGVRPAIQVLPDRHPLLRDRHAVLWDRATVPVAKVADLLPSPTSRSCRDDLSLRGPESSDPKDLGGSRFALTATRTSLAARTKS